MNFLTLAPRTFLLAGLSCLGAVWAVSFPSTAKANDYCTNLLLQGGTPNLSPAERATTVRQCLEIVNETVRSSYDTAFHMCQSQAIRIATPVAIPLQDGSTAEVPEGVTTWDEFAIALGAKANTGGCRDGLRSALVQRTFSDTKVVREIFSQSMLSVDTIDLSGEPIDIAPGIQLVVDTLSIEGRFEDTSSILAHPSGAMVFAHAPYMLQAAATMRLSMFGLLQELPQVTIRFQGGVVGSLDPVSLNVRIDDYTLEASEAELPITIPIDTTVLTDAILNALEAEGLQDDLSAALTRAMHVAYANIDPFGFLHANPRDRGF